MTSSDTVLVRVLVGHVGDLAPDTGAIVSLPAEDAEALVLAGGAVPVQEDDGKSPALPPAHFER